MEYQESFLGKLITKLAATKQVEQRTEKPTTAAQQEVLRQIKQVSRENNGNPIDGQGVTKSRNED